MTLAKIQQYLAPLWRIDWSTWPCLPMGLLGRPMSFHTRYSTVPPEAVPIVSLGVDGCHYAVWIDDVRTLIRSPGVVLVSPMDSYPDQIRWVAPSIEAFANILRPDDDWLLRNDASIARERLLAQDERRRVVTAMTADGMGVTEPQVNGAIREPLTGAESQIELRKLVEQGAIADALVLARDVIARGGPQPPGFGHAVALVYEALNRPEFADVALKSYETG